MSTITTTPTVTTTPTLTTGTTTTTAAPARSHPVRRATVTSGLVAAAAATAVAAVADAGGVPLAIEGEAIPLAGFAQMTLLGAVIGGLLAAALNRWSARPRRRFLATTVVLTIVSCIPSVTLPPDAASRAALVATHLVAAAIIVPALVRHVRAARA